MIGQFLQAPTEYETLTTCTRDFNYMSALQLRQTCESDVHIDGIVRIPPSLLNHFWMRYHKLEETDKAKGSQQAFIQTQALASSQTTVDVAIVEFTPEQFAGFMKSSSTTSNTQSTLIHLLYLPQSSQPPALFPLRPSLLAPSTLRTHINI